MKMKYLSFKFKLMLLASVAVLSTTLISCTRADDKNSSVTLSLPSSMSSSSHQKAGALAFDVLVHVVVNVTGDGMSAPVVFNWDLHQNGLGQAMAAPIQLMIPQGSNRLIQVLAVYGSAADSSTMQFFYGDKVQSLTNSNETVSLAVSSVSTADTVFSGRINGRYLRAAGDAGATGVVTASFVPSNGRPPLIVETRMMVAGWFSIMGLYGAKFVYNVYPLDGAAPFNLFGGASVDLTETYFPASSTVARFTVPISQRQNYSNGTSVWMIQNPNVNIYGFWGPSAATAGLNACVFSTPVSTQYSVSTSSTPATAGLAADISGTVPLNYATATGLPSMYLQAAANTANGIGACANAVNFTNSLIVNPKMMDNGNDGASSVYGPFEQFIASGSTNGPQVFTSTVVDAATYNIKATLLPGVSDAVASFNIFKYYGSADALPDPFLCDPDSLAMQGFTPFTTSAVTSANWSVNLPITSTDVNNKMNLAICSVLKSGRVHPVGVLLKYYSLQSYSVPVYPPTQYVPKFDGSLGSGFIANSCVPASLSIYNSMSQLADMTGRTDSVTYVPDGSKMMGLYTDSLCSTAAPNPIVFSGTNRYLYYIKTGSTAGNGSLSFTGSLPALNFTLGSLFTINSGTANFIDVVDPFSFYSIAGGYYMPYSCNMGFLQANYGSPEIGYSNYTYSSASNINVYTDSSCSGATVTGSIAGSTANTTTPIYFMPTGLSATAGFSIANSSINSSTPHAFTINTQAGATGTLTATPQMLGAPMGGSSNVVLPMGSGPCTAFEVGFFDSTGSNRGVAPNNATALTFTDDKGGALVAALSSSPTCSTMVISAQTLTGQSRILLYGRSSTALSGTLTVTGTGINAGSAKIVFQ